jgi:hypothetical protein
MQQCKNLTMRKQQQQQQEMQQCKRTKIKQHRIHDEVSLCLQTVLFVLTHCFIVLFVAVNIQKEAKRAFFGLCIILGVTNAVADINTKYITDMVTCINRLLYKLRNTIHPGSRILFNGTYNSNHISTF